MSDCTTQESLKIMRGETNAPLPEPLRGILEDYKQPQAHSLEESRIASNIDKLRRECRWSKNQLVRETGLDRSNVYRHFRGEGMREETLETYAYAFSQKLKRRISDEDLKA